MDKDTFQTPAGDLTITFVGHGTLMLTLGNTVIHIDPVNRETDYTRMPKADLILVTHEHGDHLDPAAIAATRKNNTLILTPGKCAPAVPGAIVIKNGGTATHAGITIEARPAYNLLHKRPNGEPYHPPGPGNGYLITLAGKRLYIAGDTENTPEMKSLRNIDIAFLPMNLPYTMTPAMVADAAKAIRPRILYPYHFGETDPAELVKLLDGEAGIEVRVRKMR
jgi:L-ascorbate metabolism protein UlaG (beta-lactamase superfamily)